MLGHLIESMPRRRGLRGLPGPSVSLAFHALLVLGAVVATRHSGFVITATTATQIDVPDPTERPQPTDPKIPDQPVIGRVEVPDAPVTVPVTLPPIDSGLVIDTTTLLRTRTASPDLSLGAATPEPGAVLLNDAVDEPPTMTSPPVVDYPDLLRQAGIEGSVVIEAIIDTAGRVEPASVKVLRSSNHAFESPARAAILGAIYRPGRVGGRVVRVLVSVPVAFTIRR